jgi:ATP-dependent DNA helicase RecQ
MKSLMKRSEAEIELKKKFRLNEFYDDQWTVIEKLFNGERILLIEKTGYGKSLCYQFPAVHFEGTTIVFTPLIALMRDQIAKLDSLGISAKCINSNQTEEENQSVIEDAKRNKIKLLYIAPERMENAEWLQTARQLKISMVVVDEAHCISVWGHDFRPAYRRIIQLINLLPVSFPVLATTATATKRVEEDVKKQIGKNVTSLRGNLFRENLKLLVVNVKDEDEKMVWIGKNADKLNGNGVIYAGTQVSTEIYSKWLQFLNISSVSYNAGMDAQTRIEIENDFQKNKYKMVVSTNALGMGIDKPDIRFIIHTQIPQSPIHYYQEIGRAGRDGKPSYIILFYSVDDKSLPLSFIENGKPSVSKYNRIIEIVKKDRLGIQGIVKKANMKQTQVRVILADLIEQGIINEVLEGKNKKYEYKYGAAELNTKSFEILRIAKLKELDEMINYVETANCRMKFLRDFLGDNNEETCGKCDNDLNKKYGVKIDEEWKRKVDEFKDSYFPILEVETAKTNLINGVAGSYYGFSNVGKAIHRSKYEGSGDFPDFLLKITLRAFKKVLGNIKFDLILFVPPTESGDLVKNFAQKISVTLKIPISYNLIKTRNTSPQKVFQTGLLKKENVVGAFSYNSSKEINGKNILLIDDVFDSGNSIKEIGRYLTNLGAAKIAPLAIAKTVGGDNL